MNDAKPEGTEVFLGKDEDFHFFGSSCPTFRIDELRTENMTPQEVEYWKNYRKMWENIWDNVEEIRKKEKP